MTQEPVHRDWIKLWVKECLLGSIREDLSPEERGVWYDFLILAGHSRMPGVICANENTPLSVKRIGEILNTPLELLNRCISKFQHSKRITIDEHGCIHINNWGKYQYSDYDRQKAWRQLAKKSQPGGNNSRPDPKTLKSPKGKYAENVFLTKGEYQKLIDRFGEALAKEKIEALSLGIASKGYKYKSHYATLLNWDRKDQKEARNGIHQGHSPRALPAAYTKPEDS